MNLIILCLFIFECIPQYKAKVIFNIRIHDYKNMDNVKHDGTYCDDFMFVGEKCDPIFSICVTSKQKCDIFNTKVDHWRNKETINMVFNKNIQLDTMPTLVSVLVKVDDYDSDYSHEHIGIFSSSFSPKDLKKFYKSKMRVSPVNLKVSLYASVMIKCAINFYGSQCNRFCLSDQKTYKCDVSNGSKICIKSCGNGRCNYDKHRNQFSCQCNIGWEGSLCDVFKTNNCSSLNCALTCTFTNIYRKCHCATNSTIRRECQELISLTTSSISASTKSVSVFQSSTSIQKIKLETTEISRVIINIKTIKQKKINTKTSELSKTMKFSSTTMRTTDNLIQKEKYVVPFAENSMLSQTPIMIIIIALLVLLCVCVITMSIMITIWQKKQIKKLPESNFHLRPLPTIIYKPQPEAKTTYSCQEKSGGRMQDNVYESYTVPSRNSENYSRHLIQSNYETVNFDPYEEPIITNMESLTCETDCDDSDLYETPIKLEIKNSH